VLGLSFLAVAGLSVGKSREPVKTTLHALVAMALAFGLVMGAAQVFHALNTKATGAAAFDLILLVGMLIALIHSRRPIRAWPRYPVA
jgi:hypothetical protein